MRRARTRRGAAAVVGAVAFAAAVPLLGGCGIQETDPIEAGGPASFQAFLNRDHDMLLFFRSPDGGLSPVIRTTEPAAGFGEGSGASGSGEQDLPETDGPVPTEKVVAALLNGPGEDDRAAGLSTSLPAARPGRAVEVERSPDGTVTARLPLALEGLDRTALRQLTCTIAYSQDADGQVVVELTGLDGTSRSGTCGLALGER
ncbi:hypothetical protein ACM01_32805 [Streptomyces viridochromogenes]|uniref:Lipoprotein n=1 Tax=Streptomyces viridochromogenes TaxID=1938 RepID=A0A0J7Z2Z2_STRVR|nr:hypothetical protein [Streptomyces viridochromogenes]KMS69982.1 hypothetical protein ACM01_32805 [Streptomyces viridochromogenes]KOG15620.1 hypothetical protein ADK36_28640 [Streptomyces viridochromogenes]KOG15692.1 hypothetical protein ADK35_28730 [Streptomyces viridochromogenes]